MERELKHEGLEYLAELLDDGTEDINVRITRLSDGSDGTYYFPSEEAEDLRDSSGELTEEGFSIYSDEALSLFLRGVDLNDSMRR